MFIARKRVGEAYKGWLPPSGYSCPNEVAAIRNMRLGFVLARTGECQASLVAKKVARS